MNFKEKLDQLYDEAMERFGTAGHREQYKKMIRYGAMGELRENYYLFIYRDFFRNAAYYGAVIFLNRPDDLGNPVRIHCIEQDGIEQPRNVYIRAALFFLENDCDNTMDVAGKIRDVFNQAKEKIYAYIDQESSSKTELEKFNFDVSNQTVTFKEIEHKKFTQKIKSSALKKQLAMLKETRMIPMTETETLGKPKARLGLNLKTDYIGITEGKKMLFQPVAIPLKVTGEYGNPRKITPTDVTKYEFIGLNPILENFLNHFAALDHHLFSDSLKTKIMNQLYFSQLMEEIFSLPEELKFCQSESFSKTYNPLKTITFRTVRVRFAPSLKKETVFRIRLKFTAQVHAPVHDDEYIQELDAGDHYILQVTDQNIYIFFTSSEGDHYLAIPEKPEYFHRFFQFLDAGQEFYIFDFRDVVSALQGVESKFLEMDSQLLKKYVLNLRPVPVLKIYPHDPVEGKNERIEVHFDYIQVIRKFLEKHPDKEVFTYKRDSQFENMCLRLLGGDPLLKQEMDYDNLEKSVYYYFYFREGDYLKWVIERGKFYLDKDFRIYIAEWKRYIGTFGSQVHVAIQANIDWLEFKATVHDSSSGNGKGIEIDAIDLEKNIVTDKKGTLHLLTKKEIEKLRDIYQYSDHHGNLFRVPSKNYILINKLYDKKMEEIPELKETLRSGKKLKKFEKIEDYPVSSTFNGQLRGYQTEGFKWLYFLREYGFSGCLADDMGLGKTVQTLALLQSLKDKGLLKTSLLVVPVSAIPNWEMETERFTRLTFYRHIGIKRDKDTEGWETKDLVITSYATLRIDIELFSDFGFDYVILDESQNIKNYTSQVSRAAKILKGNHRLALSGTPIENTSLELWSLFDFLMPGYLGTSRWFSQQFAAAIEREKNSQKIDLLKKLIYPFILRRKKEEVESELPDKTEIVTKLRMEDEQLKLYAETAAYYREEIENEIEKKGISKSSMKILEGMLRLRQLCLFPQLVNEKFKGVPSAKFDHFTELMEDILSENHKVLVFSQFVEVLKIIRGHFNEENIAYSYIDGSVNIKTREKMIKTFQEENNQRVFLLSLKAGGVALNLTAADYVIIFDPWWNPAVEAQAIDRSHRIGQTKKVFVYRMVVEDSIEEKMLQLQEEKKALVENLIASDAKTFKNLKKEEILKLFR
jgi:superfamily II DNA or RNA helicase